MIRALLVPAIVRLAGDWTWWLPDPVAKVLFIEPRKPPAYESD